MNASNEGSQSSATVARLPRWLVITGALVSVGSIVLEIRLIWEQTVWTWEQGPQMVGFSLAHGAGAILLVFPLLLVGWMFVVILLTARSWIRKNRIAVVRWVVLALTLTLVVIGELPDGFWQRLFITRMAASPRAGDLLVYAAYRGDLGTVRGLVSRGVPVDANDRGDWDTAMHGAAVKGDLPTLRYLVSRGANINALNRSGDSPAERAASANRADALKFLTEIGAKRIRGTDEQRKKASYDKVREDMERADPDLKKLHEQEDSERLQGGQDNSPTYRLPQ